MTAAQARDERAQKAVDMEEADKEEAATEEAATEEAAKETGEAAAETALYVYGVVPADVVIDPGAKGVGDPRTPVGLVAHGGVAALVGEIPLGSRLGTPEDLVAHAEILDGAAAEVPVLPLRFGAVMADRDAVVTEFLAPHERRFSDTLKSLEGRVQLVAKGRYVQETVLREIIGELPEARRLQERIAQVPEDASRDDRVALGELIAAGVEARRRADTTRFAELLDGLGIAYAVREPTHELDAIHLACLLKRADEGRLMHECARFARDQENRIDMQLLGPMAAYDFVGAGPPEG